MIFVGRFLRIGIAFTLLRHDMDKHRPVFHIADILQDANQMVHIVSINGTDIVKAKLFKQCAAGYHTATIFFRPAQRLINAARQAFGQLLGEFTKTLIDAGRGRARQIGAHRTNRRSD